VSEAATLKFTDIDGKRMTILARGKGNKDRYSLLGENALEILRMSAITIIDGKVFSLSDEFVRGQRDLSVCLIVRVQEKGK
jgi:integrase